MLNENMNNEVNKSTKQYTFWKLISCYSIEIPIIQRDYAQGRLTDNESAIRSELLSCIFEALQNKTHIDFDFIYGNVENNTLFPLDGQQRLTTFFLLHWYLAQKEHKMETARKTLLKFSYSTRISSREFCRLLVKMDYNPYEDEAVSEYIRNQYWYFNEWNQDPTINAMIVMLDEIHQKFFSCNPLFDLLISDDNPILSFYFLEMNNYSLTDDLYIKMNARGKPLSTFENFKAKFIQHLRNNNLPHEHFESYIDGKWLDLLWEYRLQENKTIDEQFMNLFCYLTNMINLLVEEPHECEAPYKKDDIRKLVAFYDDEDKVELLYQLLDLWQGRSEVSSFFQSIFSKEREIEKVRIFDGTPDIFSEIVLGRKVSLPNQVFAFMIMERLIYFGKDKDANNFNDFARIVRNLLMDNRQFSSSRCVYDIDFRYGRQGIPFAQYINDYLVQAENPYEEISKDFLKEYGEINYEVYQRESRKAKCIIKNPKLKKIIAKFEDSTLYKGSIDNILDLIVDIEDERLIDCVEELFSSEKSVLTMRALLSIGDFSIALNNTKIGERHYFGGVDGWYIILTYPNNNQNIIKELIRKVFELSRKSTIESLNEIINTNLPNISCNDWRYSLVKYPSTLGKPENFNYNQVTFVFNNSKNGIILHRLNGTTLNSRHIVPEYLEVAKQIKNSFKYILFGLNSDEMGGIRLSCREEYIIDVTVDEKLPIRRSEDVSDEVYDAIEEEYKKTIPDEADHVEKLVFLIKCVLAFDNKS